MRVHAQLLARDIFRYEDVMLQPCPSAQSLPQGLVGLRRDVPRFVYPEALKYCHSVNAGGHLSLESKDMYHIVIKSSTLPWTCNKLNEIARYSVDCAV